MNLKKLVLAAALTGLLAIPASAQILSPGTAPARTSAYTGAPTFFGDEEFSIDAFGSVTVAEGRLRRDHWRQDRLGLGVGMNYFHMRYFGIGADTYFGRLDVPDQISVSAIFRWPIDQVNLAPYAFGGGARHWKPRVQWTGHLGGGLDWRLNAHMGVFSDARYNFAQHSGDFGLVRLGVRFAF